MQPKKYPEANLESRRSIHIQIGLVVVLALVLVSLEWVTPDERVADENNRSSIQPFEPDLIVQIPREEKKKEEIPQVLIPIPVDDNIPVESIDPGRFTAGDDPTRIPQSWFEDLIGEEPEETKPFEPVDVSVMATFPGGEEAMMKWIYSNIKYPKICSENGVEGMVTAKFTITKFGDVKDIQIIRKAHPDLDAEVIRVLKMMPKFTPAMQNQQLVPVYMYWPVIFKLE